MRTKAQIRNKIAFLLAENDDPALDVTFADFAQIVNNWTSDQKQDFIKKALKSDRSVSEIVAKEFQEIRKTKAISAANIILTDDQASLSELDRFLPN